MAYDVKNATLGAGTLYIATFGAVEPTDATTTPAPAVWTDLGGTNDGTTLSIAQEFAEITMDQIVDRAESRLISRTITLSTNLAEQTLANFKTALTGGTITAGTGKETFAPATASNLVTNYNALILDVPAPGQKKRRIILRKVLSTDNVEMQFSKGSQTVTTVTFTAHAVSSSIDPFVILDEKTV